MFCNEVAANALVPQSRIDGLYFYTFNNAREVFQTARRFGVSSYALLVRALNLNMITVHNYQKLKREADIEFNEFLRREAERKVKQKEKEGGPNPYLLQLNRNSRLFTQTVLDAYYGGNIEPTQASSLLNVQVNKFPKLEAQLYK